MRFLAIRLLLALVGGTIVIVYLVSDAIHQRFIKTPVTTVHFVNALDEPVDIAIDRKHALTVEPKQHPSVAITAGPHSFRVTSRARTALLDEVTIDVPPRVRCAVFNVLGAGTIERYSITYSTEARTNLNYVPPPETHEVHAGDVFYSHTNVDLVFTQPPETIQLGHSEGTRVRWGIRTPDDASWSTTVLLLSERGQRDAAFALVRRIARLQPGDAATLTRAQFALTAAGLADSIGRLTSELIVLAPPSLALQWLHRQAMIADGRRAEVAALVDVPTPPRNEGPFDEEPEHSALANLLDEGKGATPSARIAGAEPSALVRVTEAALQSRDATVEAYVHSALTPEWVGTIDPYFACVLAAALTRAGQRDKAEDLIAHTFVPDVSRDAMRAAVLDGVDTSERRASAPRTRAALAVALALHATDKAKQQRWAKAALADEPQPGMIRMLIKRWL